MSLLSFIAVYALGQAQPTTLSVESLAETVAAKTKSPESCGLYVKAPSEELARAFTTVFLGRVQPPGSWTTIDAPSAEEAEKKARSLHLNRLVVLQLKLAEKQLWATGEVFSTWVNFWSGATPTRSATPAFLVNASVPLDAHVLRLARKEGPKKRLHFQHKTLLTLPKPPAALATGNLLGDDIPEIALLVDDELRIYDVAGRQVSSWALSGLPRAAYNVRGNRALLEIDSTKRQLLVFRFEHSEGVWLSFNSQPTVASTFSRTHVPLAGGTLVGQAIDGQTEFLSSSTPLAIRQAQWRSNTLLLTHPFGRSTVTGAGAGGATKTLEGLGDATALIDVDDDGVFEILSSTHAYMPDVDTLTVYRLQDEARPHLRVENLLPVWRGEIPQGLALLSSPMEVEGEEAFLVATLLPSGGSDILLFQRSQK